MKLFDLIHDNDALIEGLIVAKQGDDFRVLWNNGIIGDVIVHILDIAAIAYRYVVHSHMPQSGMFHDTAFQRKISMQ